MSQVENKDQIMSAFDRLLAEITKSESKVETKEQEAEKEKNQQLLATVSSYTIDNIVNGMASLQLNFSSAVDRLSEQLITESTRLEELKKAIAVENEHLEELKKIRLVADALYILRQEHQEQLRILQNFTTTQQEAVDKEITQTRKLWAKETEDFTVKIAEETELLTSQREKEVADYEYETQLKRQVETDEYETTKRQQERELRLVDRAKVKAWSEREKLLTDNQQEFTENRQKVEGFEAKLKEEYNKAKVEAIKEAERDAKVKSDLFEKEWKAAKQGYELKITSLEATIQRQTEQIAELTTQLQTVTTQAQNLALRAFSSAA